MKIRLITVFRNENETVNELADDYVKRISHYTKIELVPMKVRHTKKLLTIVEQKKEEAVLILKHIHPGDCVVILDELGKEFTSAKFAEYIRKKMDTSVKSLVFIIGGAFGFDERLYQRKDDMICLTRLTLPHQLAKLVFAEQLYRAFTIIKNEKYHH
jgi:23S rRNA (pseudouridine1915-N3)-methyltransferase